MSKPRRPTRKLNLQPNKPIQILATRNDDVSGFFRDWIGFAGEQRLVGVGSSRNNDTVYRERLTSGNPNAITRPESSSWNALQVGFIDVFEVVEVSEP